ncbi:Calcium-dependent lipid-binding [Hirschfeldia incana]|nr:Calcium-dependent lipid-binding [Hirschfeldia incana]
MSMFASFQLLELNLISAQDLAPVSRKMKTYAVAWVHSERKLTTRVDYTGGTNPTWNDKFVFRVSEDFLYADTSAVVVEIYALHWFRDVHVGTIRVLISNLIPPNRRPGYRTNEEYRHTPPPGMRFVALQVRRPSGRPQGILNIGVGILDGSMRSMPLYTNMDSSAVGYRDLLGEEDPHLQNLHLNSFKGSSKNLQSPSSKQNQSVVSRPPPPPMLRRTRSDTSSMVVSDLLSRAERSRMAKPVSALPSSDDETTTSGHHTTTDDSVDDYEAPYKTPHIPGQRYDSFEDEISPNEFVDQQQNVMQPRSERYDESPYRSYDHSRKTPRRSTPVIEKPRPPPRDYDRSNRASPYLSRHGTPLRSNIVASTPIISNSPMRSTGVRLTPMRSNMVAASSPMRSTPMRSNIVGSTPLRSNIVGSTPIRSNYMGTPMKSPLRFGTPMRSNLAGRLILTESELGPSPSEVANKLAKERSQANDTESSILSEWSLDDDSNIEGLRSKLERWRTELPPLYDLGSSHQSSDVSSAIVPVSASAGGGKSSRKKTPTTVKKKKHNRRHTEGGNGLFSCFSNICGAECTFVCGGGSDHDGSKKKGGSKRLPRLASADNLSYV